MTAVVVMVVLPLRHCSVAVEYSAVAEATVVAVLMVTVVVAPMAIVVDELVLGWDLPVAVPTEIVEAVVPTEIVVAVPMATAVPVPAAGSLWPVVNLVVAAEVVVSVVDCATDAEDALVVWVPVATAEPRAILTETFLTLRHSVLAATDLAATRVADPLVPTPILTTRHEVLATS